MKKLHQRIVAALMEGPQPCPYRWEPPKSASIVPMGVLPERLQGLGVLLEVAQRNFLRALTEGWALPAQVVLRDELAKDGITFLPGQCIHIGKDWQLYAVPREIRKAALEAEQPDLFRALEIIDNEVRRELGASQKENPEPPLH